MVPSGEKTTELTHEIWPSRADPMADPVSTSHRCTVVSPDAEASLLPSGEETTEWTPELWPSNVLKEFVYNPWLGVVIGRLAIVAI